MTVLCETDPRKDVECSLKGRAERARPGVLVVGNRFARVGLGFGGTAATVCAYAKRKRNPSQGQVLTHKPYFSPLTEIHRQGGHLGNGKLIPIPDVFFTDFPRFRTQGGCCRT